MFLDAFAGKTVLVTGHTGFKGAWLSCWLHHLGASVVGYALEPPTRPNLFESTGMGQRIIDIRADIRDTAMFRRVLDEHRPDFVFHMAAQALVLESYLAPQETFAINVGGTVSVLEALRTAKHPCVVVMVTTDKVYENREWVHGYREVDPLGGIDPYSASKAAMEIVVSSYRQSFFPPERLGEHGVRLASARAGNVIGGGDWAANRIVPDAIRALIAGQPLEVRHPTALRPWQHVLEPLSGYLWLAARMAQPGGEYLAGPWNFGPLPGQEHTVGELADAIVAAWGDGAWVTQSDSRAPHEANQLRLSIDKVYAILNWLPVWDFATTVHRTVDWYKQSSNRSGDALYQLCLDDISAYIDSAIEADAAWIS